MNPNINLPAEVIQARQKAQELGGTYGNLKAAEPSVSDVLTQKVRDAYADNQDVIKPLDAATATYYESPALAREKYQNIFNPFQRENLVSQYVSNSSLPMMSYSSIYGNRMGRVDDIIGAGTRAFQAQVAKAQADYENAKQNYSDLISEYTSGENMKLDREKFEWQKKQDLIDQANKGNSRAADQSKQTAETWSEILDQATDETTGEVDYNKVWKIIDLHQSGMRASGIDVDALWKWQKELAARMGASFDSSSNLTLDSVLNPSWKSKPFNQKSIAGINYLLGK